MAEKIMEKCVKRIQDRGEKALEKKVSSRFDRTGVEAPDRERSGDGGDGQTSEGASRRRRASDEETRSAQGQAVRSGARRSTVRQTKCFRFTIRCKIDSTDICSSTDVRTINGSSYVCVDTTIWSRMKIKTREMSNKVRVIGCWSVTSENNEVP